MRITEFAAAMGSRVVNLHNDFEIAGISTLEDAVAGQVSFVSDKKHLKDAHLSRASALLLSESLDAGELTAVPLKEPWAGVLFLLNKLFPNSQRRWFAGVHSSAFVDPSAQLGEDVSVGPNAVVGPGAVIGAGTSIGPCCVIGPDCQIGSRCTIMATAVLEAGTKIGNGVILHPGSVLGADGFKYEPFNGKWTKIPQVGTVTLGDNVEVGANACIDRASFTETVIGENTKIDNLVQVAHNATVGSNCILVSQCGVAGSTRIGDNVIVTAQAGIADNLRIGNGAIILAQAGVKDNIEDGQAVIGSPARPVRHQARIFAVENKLPELSSEVSRLVKRVAELERQLASKQGSPETKDAV